MRVAVEDLKPTAGKAVVRLTGRRSMNEVLPSGLVIHRKDADGVHTDWEEAMVTALGHGDCLHETEGVSMVSGWRCLWDPVGIGDTVLVAGALGGVAGSDIGRLVGERRSTVVVVNRDEIVAKVA